MAYASDRTMGGVVTSVGSSVLTTGRRAGRTQWDLVAVGSTSRGGTEVLAIGEVKAGAEPVGPDLLSRLDAAELQVAALRATRVRATAPLKKLLVARAGFTVELQRLVRHRHHVELVDLHRLLAGE